MAYIGSYFPDRDQPPLDPEERDLVELFHDLYYRRWRAGGDTINLSWFGHQVWKCPLDLWVYQELLVRTRPDFVIETGTHRGGSALFMAAILDQIDHGHIITIDIKEHPQRPVHPRITYLTGSSVDPSLLRAVKEKVAGHRVMVILDSDHRADHVFTEIQSYGPLVWVGDYLIVEDTNVNGHPTYRDFGPGPMEAVERLLGESDEFAADPRCERFLMTLNPNGYLKRVRPAGGTR